jgi:hypothetical protein
MLASYASHFRLIRIIVCKVFKNPISSARDSINPVVNKSTIKDRRRMSGVTAKSRYSVGHLEKNLVRGTRLPLLNRQVSITNKIIRMRY